MLEYTVLKTLPKMSLVCVQYLCMFIINTDTNNNTNLSLADFLSWIRYGPFMKSVPVFNL